MSEKRKRDFFFVNYTSARNVEEMVDWCIVGKEIKRMKCVVRKRMLKESVVKTFDKKIHG